MIKTFVHHRHGESGKLVLQGLVPFTDLLNCAVFTQRVDNYSDDEIDIEKSNEYYQRRLNPNRLKEIQQYIYQTIVNEQESEDITTLFPTSMILAMDYDDSLLKEVGGVCSFDLPKRVFVVDGQHRLMAMKMLFKGLKESNFLVNSDMKAVIQYLELYRFSCTILVNYDLWEQGQVFANVNFKQKPVNRSLYYEIYGSEYRENIVDWKRNNIYLAHHLVKFMNEQPTSPFYQHIRMLGTGKGYVSQAFFVEALLRHFRQGGLWWYNADSPEFSDNSYRYMAVELLTYYDTVKSLFEKYWPKADDAKGSLICKTTGTGALVRLLGDMREKEDEDMKKALMETEVGDVCETYRQQVRKRLQPVVEIGEEIFGAESKYGGTGGKGLESALYKRMKDEIKKAKLIKDLPIMKMSPEERERGLEMAKHASVYGRLYFRGIKNLEDKLDDYLSTHSIDDVDSRGNHYVYKQMDYLRYTQYKEDENKIHIEGKCSIMVDSYLDSEEEVKIPMGLPCSFSLEMVKEEVLEAK